MGWVAVAAGVVMTAASMMVYSRSRHVRQLAFIKSHDGFKRAWRPAGGRERLHPNDPGKLPLIFGIDALLDIPGGFVYVPNCRDPSSPGYGSGFCAGHIGCAGGGAGDSGAADSERGFFDGLFDGFNCGSDCGGGCGGD